MDILKNNSVRIDPGTIVVWPQFGQEEVLNIEELRSKFPGRYATNNSTICFIDREGQIYVTPYTRKAITTLKADGYHEATFYVPFSNWDYPKCHQKKWEGIKAEAEATRRQEFAEDCTRWCVQHGLGSIDQTSLNRCFRMPEEGVAVIHPRFQDRYYPVISSLDAYAIELIGTYDTNNGKVVFIHCDGSTYVAKGYWIIPLLRSAGYREKGLFVPFSNGETIVDPTLRAKWENIPKNHR